MHILPGNSQNILILHICPFFNTLWSRRIFGVLESSSIASLTSHLPPFRDGLIVAWISIVLALLPMISTCSVHQNDSIWNVDRIDVRDVTLRQPGHILLMPADMVKIAHIKKILPPTVTTKASVLRHEHALDSWEVGEQFPCLNRADTLSVDWEMQGASSN